MRKLLNRKIVEPNRQCPICQVAFTNYSDIVPEHIDPRGMGGARRSSREYPGCALLVQWGKRIHEGVLVICPGVFAVARHLTEF
jgi:hypothetical protein